MKYLAALALAVLAAGCAVPDTEKARFTVHNRTGQPVMMRASMGPFSRQIVLQPDSAWDGWVWTPLLAKGQVRIEITAAPK